jgi:hypothetical protein
MEVDTTTGFTVFSKKKDWILHGCPEPKDTNIQLLIYIKGKFYANVELNGQQKRLPIIIARAMGHPCVAETDSVKFNLIGTASSVYRKTRRRHSWLKNSATSFQRNYVKLTFHLSTWILNRM